MLNLSKSTFHQDQHMSTRLKGCHIYEGPGDDLMEQADAGRRVVVVDDGAAGSRDPDPVQRIRIMWGQRLIDDLMAGRYRTLVCAVNTIDNRNGFIHTLAERLPTSQWREPGIASYARHFADSSRVRVLKYDMDLVEVLALLRPTSHDHLTLADLAEGFGLVTAMLRCRPERFPVASVSFLGARANRLLDADGQEPSFETVLKVMYDSGYRGDVYPSPQMWNSAPTAVFPRYPFPESLTRRCEGGY
jgi:hypothetical protein